MSLPFLVNRIPGQPIIYVRLMKVLTSNDTAAYYAEIADLAGECKGAYYRVIDLAEIPLKVGNMAQLLEHVSAATPGSVYDPRVVKNFCIASDEQSHLLRSLMEQSPLLSFPLIIVESLEQALNTIYAETEDNDDSTENTQRGGRVPAPAG